MLDWALIKDIVGSALELPASARQAYVFERCASDSELLAEVLRLIANADGHTTFLDEGPMRVSLPSRPAFDPGAEVCGRFIITRWIASGGMGEVYEAYDPLLNVTVALKTIRSGPGFDERFAARVRKEVQLAREVTHPNVCRVHDLFHHRFVPAPGEFERFRGAGGVSCEVQFVSMEFLHGETLTEKLQRDGALPPDTAKQILIEIAQGLAAAHQAGVVHRDLKPGNIILVPTSSPRLRPVITDFGLATRSWAAGNRSSTVSFAGTVGYMSPEQLHGKRATFASDVYAFGVVAYQTITGHHPHEENENEPADAAQRSLDAVDSLWARVILQCLEQDPERRFASASDLLRALTSGAPQSSGSSPASAPSRLRPYALAFVIVLLAVALSALLFRYSYQTPRIEPGAAVVLTNIRVPGPEFEAITTVLKSQLSQSPEFVLLDDAREIEILKQMARSPDPTQLDPNSAREVALRAGAPLVIFGALAELGQEYVLTLKVEQIAGSPLFARKTWKSEFSAPNVPGLFDAAHRAGLWVRRLAGEAPRDLAEQDRRPEDTTTSSWPALQLYTRALRAASAGQESAAVLLLEEAVQLDPQFASAHAKMADLLMALKRYREGYEAWQRALALSKERLLTSREYLRINGQYAEDTGDLAAAEQNYRTFIVHYPNDYLPAFLLGSVLTDRGRYDEAITQFVQVCARWPKEYAAAVHLAWLYLIVSRYSDAAAVTRKVRALGQEEWARWLDSLSLFSQGDTAGALAAAAAFASAPEEYWKSRSFIVRGCWLDELGHVPDAMQQLKDGAAFDNAHGLRQAASDKHLLLAQMLLQTGGRSAARDECSTAHALDDDPRRAARAGMVLARAGYVAEARNMYRALQQHAAIPRLDALRIRLGGEIALAQHAPERALALFRQAVPRSPARECMEQLARALAATGDRAAAAAAYKQIIDTPALFWGGPQTDLPGLNSESRRIYMTLRDTTR